MIIKRIVFNFLLGLATLFCFTQCDTTSAEEYKAQAIGYAERGERAKAAEAYLKAAEKGDSESQFAVGLLYMSGDVLPNNPFSQDIETGLKWYQKSANQDNDMALLTLGNYYADYKNDTDKAVQYWEKSAEKGNYMAKFLLGSHYLSNHTASVSLQKVEQYLDESYHSGCLSAGYCLAGAYIGKELRDDKVILGAQIGQEIRKQVDILGINFLDLNSILEYDYAMLWKSKNIKI